jgi:hypothetical protein
MRNRGALAREKEIHNLSRQSKISSASPSTISDNSIPTSSRSSLRSNESQKNKVNPYRMFNNSNSEKKLHDRLHEAVQLDYVNIGPEILSDPTKLAEAVNKRWHEIFQKEPYAPLPGNTIQRVHPPSR